MQGCSRLMPKPLLLVVYLAPFDSAAKESNGDGLMVLPLSSRGLSGLSLCDKTTHLGCVWVFCFRLKPVELS